MTVKEARKIIAVMMVAYPNYKPKNTELTASIWAEVLSDYSYEQINRALKQYILTEDKGFAPSPGQIIAKIPTDVPEITPGEAWSLVSKALRNSAYNYKAEYDALPPAVKRAVGSAEQLHYWALDEDYNEGVVMSQVIRSFQMATEQEKEYARLPENVQRLTAELLQSRM